MIDFLEKKIREFFGSSFQASKKFAQNKLSDQPNLSKQEYVHVSR